MRFLLKTLPICLFFLATSLQAQQQACCDADASAHTRFAALADADGFAASHEEPLPIDTIEFAGEWLKFLTPDGGTGRGYYIAAAEPTRNYLFVIHEWWGLNGHIMGEAERLREALGNVHVIALDLYDGKVATDRESAAQYMQSAEESRVRAIIQGAIHNVGPEARIATIGWCFGGGWSMQSSMMAGKQGAGCVIYYGMPEKEVEKMKTLETDVLGIFAKQDRWINEDVVKTFAENMESAGKTLTYKIFDAAHAFANPSRPIYDESAAKEANDMTLEFLRTRLK